MVNPSTTAARPGATTAAPSEPPRPPEPTPLGRRAERQNLSVSLRNGEGETVRLSSGSTPTLSQALSLSDAAFAERFPGIDRRDFNAAVTDALNRNQQSYHLDLTAAGNAIYTDAADFNASARPVAPDSMVRATVTGTDGAFEVSGGVVDSGRGFWAMLGDILLEIITLSFASTSWGNGNIDQGDWQSRGRLLAAAGGSAFRAALGSGEAREQLVSQLKQHNSHLSDTEADAMARSMLAGAESFYREIDAQTGGVDTNGRLDQIAQTLSSGTTQRLYLNALREAGPADRSAVASRLLEMVTSDSFRTLPEQAQVALLSQAANYPNPTSIENLTRLAGADWFRTRPAGVSPDMTDLAHQQRSAAMVAELSARIDRLERTPNATEGQRESCRILDNTVNQFLPTRAADGTVTQGRFRVSWETYHDAPNHITYGSAIDGTLSLNSAIIPAGNGRVPDTEEAQHVVLSTTPHEVNHLMNGDRVRPTFEYFMGEYGAWYAGYVAEHGKEPTRQECYERARYLLTQTEGAYRHIRDARLSKNADGTPSPDAQAIMRFMGQFFDEPRPATADGIVEGGHSVPRGSDRTRDSRPPSAADAPLIRSDRNMDNGGTPLANRTGPAGVDYSALDALYAGAHHHHD